MMLVAIGDMHNRRDGWLCMRFLVPVHVICIYIHIQCNLAPWIAELLRILVIICDLGLYSVEILHQNRTGKTSAMIVENSTSTGEWKASLCFFRFQ
ncbi:hypothetical protein L208DRAFT_1439356 [Tricholoma matsutake]|nr:hypothetical protein L208DRAFT_1439356 [Tricholoma matsutake 945]